MPIRPENKARYPKDWKAISLRIRARSNGRCECHGECGRLHHTEDVPARLVGKEVGRCAARNYQPNPITGTKVIFTVAHLDHTPENCADDNLKAMCQRCHLLLDIKTHMRNAAETRRNRRASGDLFA